jgi:hypothetical protein
VAVDPSDYFELTINELREVARFAAQGAQEVLGVFERADPEDRRPRTAIEAAWEFANGARRTRLQRVAALDAHRAAKMHPPKRQGMPRMRLAMPRQPPTFTRSPKRIKSATSSARTLMRRVSKNSLLVTALVG